MTPQTSEPIPLSRRAGIGLLSAAALLCAPVFAQEQNKLVELINEYRASPGRCAGTQLRPAGALAPDPALARVRFSSGTALQQALKKAGFQAARAEAIAVSGPKSAAAAMAAIRDRYCRLLARPEYAAIGVSRSANTWRIVLAQPLLAPDLGDPLTAGKKVLELVNAARSEARACGNKRFSAANPVAWSDTLTKAALAHSSDMATRNYFRHEGRDGATVGKRAQQAGYRWQYIGENIAAGQGAAQHAVAGWLASPGHCANIMNRNFNEMGAAYAVNRKSDLSIYWTQVFGARR